MAVDDLIYLKWLLCPIALLDHKRFVLLQTAQQSHLREHKC
jgi:hypothetical protein